MLRIASGPTPEELARMKERQERVQRLLQLRLRTGLDKRPSGDAGSTPTTEMDISSFASAFSMKKLKGFQSAVKPSLTSQEQRQGIEDINANTRKWADKEGSSSIKIAAKSKNLLLLY